MKLTELFENQATRIIVIFPGRFQPPHPGHLHGYLELVNKFGAENVYISMTEKTDLAKSPFLYDERVAIFTDILGIPSNKILKVTKQYKVKELSDNMNLKPNTAIVFAVSDKDIKENKFSVGRDKEGTESYMKEYKNDIVDTFMHHSYIIKYPSIEFNLHGQLIHSATQLRELFRKSSVAKQKKLFEEIYGKLDERIFKMFLDKFGDNYDK